MCGRFAFSLKPENLQFFTDIDYMSDLVFQNFNAAPGQFIPNVHLKGDFTTIDNVNWGLRTDKYFIINAKAENLNSFPHKQFVVNKYLRGVVLANGYYEWKKNKNEKIPYFIHGLGKVFAMPTVIYFDELVSKLPTFSIITRPANSSISEAHHRMPVIFESKEQVDAWFSSEMKSISILKDFLFAEKNSPEVKFYEVSKDVNNVINNNENLIMKVERH